MQVSLKSSPAVAVGIPIYTGRHVHPDMRLIFRMRVRPLLYFLRVRTRKLMTNCMKLAKIDPIL